MNEFSRFGCRVVVALSLVTALSQCASAQGLLGTWYNFPTTPAVPTMPPLGTPGVFSRIDGPINLSCISACAGAVGMNANNFGVRWTGTIFPLGAGDYLLSMTINDGVRLWIDGDEDNDLDAADLVIDDWTTKTSSVTHSTNFTFENHTWHRIQIEFFDNTATAAINLRWQPPQASFMNLVPAGNLSPSVIPEPGAMTMVLGGLVVALGFFRRARRGGLPH